MVSARFLIDGIELPNAVVQRKAPGDIVNLSLDSIKGVRKCVWEIFGIYPENIDAPTITQSGSPFGSTASFTIPALSDGYGVAFGIRLTVNNGRDENGSPNENLTYTSKVYVPNASGWEVYFPGETLESNTEEGWANIQRELAAASAGLGGVTALDGDVTGALNFTYVSKLQGTTVDAASPTDGYVLTYDGYSDTWIPEPANGTFAVNTITPPSFSTAQTDYEPAGWASARYVRLDVTANADIYSFSSVGLSQKRKTLINVGGDFDIRIHHDSYQTSVAANRVQGVYPNDMYLLRGFSLDLWYDDTSLRWRPV